MTEQNVPTSNALRATALFDLLEKQANFYRQLKQLSQQQSELVATAQAEPLLALLSQRQALIDQLAVIDTDLATFRKSWDQIIATLNDSDRKRIKKLVNEVQSCLSEIVEQDDRDQKKLLEVKTTVTNEMGKMTRANAAARAYQAQPAAAASNRFTNQQG